MIGAIKIHDSISKETQQETVRLAAALESLLLTTADVFSFWNKRASYEEVAALLEEEQLVDVIFYECMFFVPGKTQSPNRNKAKRLATRKAAY